MTTPRVGVGPALLAGLGSPDRGDDAVGPIVAQRIATLRLPGVQVLEREDPTSLIDLWAGRDLAIVVDAVCSNGVPGTLMIMESGVGGAPLTDDAWAGTGRGGTHAFGLAAAVELSRALHRLPRRLVLIGIEAGGMDHGAPLTAPVSAAVERAVRAARGILSETGALPSRRNRETGSGPARFAQEVDR
jgi:hydrogenase maturation protease